MVRLGFLVFVLWLGQAQALVAGPYQGGTLSWERDSSFVSATDVRFNVRVDLTLDWNGAFTPFQPAVGQDVSNSQFRFSLISNLNLIFQTVPFTLTVTEVNATEGWFKASRTLPITIAISRLPARIRMNECCRSDVLRDNNHNAFFRLETTVPAPASAVQASPRSAMPARLYWLQNQPALAQLAFENLAGVTSAFAIAPASQSALLQARPGGTLQLTPDGVMSWQPPLPGLHAVQFRFLTLDDTGATVASVPYDVIIDVVPECRAFVIGCNTAPAFIPDDPGSFTARVGELLRVPIVATDFDYTDTVEVAHTPLAEGMTFTLDSTTRNTSRYTLEWTPARADLLGDPQHLICFRALDSRGATTDGTYCVTVVLDTTSGTPPAISCPAPQTLRGGSAGVATVSLDASIEGAGGRAMSVFWNTPSGPTVLEMVTGADAHTWSVTGDLVVGTHSFEARAEFATGAVSCTTSVTVTPRQAQQISVTPVDPITLPSGPVTLSATATSGLPVTFEVVSGPGSVSGNVLTLAGAGTVQMMAHQGGDEDWLPAPSVAFAVVVNPEPPPPPPPPPPPSAVYSVCDAFAHQLGIFGGPVIVRLRVCDASGQNVSSRTLRVAATGLVDDQGVSHDLRVILPFGSTGAFVFDAFTRSYYLVFKSYGLADGTYDLQLAIGADEQPESLTVVLGSEENNRMLRKVVVKRRAHGARNAHVTRR
jgi:hypothetical protein